MQIDPRLSTDVLKPLPAQDMECEVLAAREDVYPSAP